MYKSYQGWYKLSSPSKFIKPLDEYMQSFKDGKVLFKSKLEYKAFRYADLNPKITKWSLEPFAIPYISPIDGKPHRYYIDLFIEFITQDKFLVEIKSSSDLKKPRVPCKKTTKAILNYQEKLKTYLINQAKWEQARKFCDKKGLKFIILTEIELMGKAYS